MPPWKKSKLVQVLHLSFHTTSKVSFSYKKGKIDCTVTDIRVVTSSDFEKSGSISGFLFFRQLVVAERIFNDQH